MHLNIKYLDVVFSRKFRDVLKGPGAEEHNITQLCIPGLRRLACNRIGNLFFIQKVCMQVRDSSKAAPHHWRSTRGDLNTVA